MKRNDSDGEQLDHQFGRRDWQIKTHFWGSFDWSLLVELVGSGKCSSDSEPEPSYFRLFWIMLIIRAPEFVVII